MATPLSRAVLDELRWHLRSGRVCVLSGAGLSTDSGIPDYRGPSGALKTRTPVRYHEFLRSAEDRQRYWARSYVGWPFMRSRVPNAGHQAIAALETNGTIENIITQNVDGLHQKAGSADVVELHGGLDRVVCLSCDAVVSREVFQNRMRSYNPEWQNTDAEEAPDGDAELPRSATRDFNVPTCDRCGGVLKPDVVFFGENVPKTRVADAFTRVAAADVLLVVGSSLTVYSGYRFAGYAVKEGKSLLIVNAGPTRADSIASLKVDAPIVTVLPPLVGHAS